MAAASLAEFTTTVQAMVASTARTFTRPNDDWISVLFLQPGDGPITFVALAFDEASLDLTETFVKEQIRSNGATRYALLNSAWMAEDEQLPGMRVRDQPGAYEVLMLTVGDAESESVWLARIQRRVRKPPALAPWRKTPYEGRFTDLASAMREVR